MNCIRQDIFRAISSSASSLQNLGMESFFIVKDPAEVEQRTFYWDDRLPPLPVPDLEDTARKYLKSCRPVLNDDEYQRTKAILQEFVAGEGQKLQRELIERSKYHKNWLEEWWLDSYLLYRRPSAPLNFSGLPRFTYWPLTDQLKSTALLLHLFMKFWQLLREERLRQQSDAKGNPFSMFQFRQLFNTCRIPYAKKDKLLCAFKTVYEGDCPNHLVIFYKKRLYKINGVCEKTGEICSPDQFHRMLLTINENKEEGVGIALLTELDRDEWAAARSHLLELSPRNSSILADIQTALFCATITDLHHKDYTELISYGAVESYGHRWMDKMNLLCSKDNDFVVNTDHTPLEGMVIVTMISYMEANLQTLKKTGLAGIWGDDSLPINKPVELAFEIDDKIKSWVQKGNEVAKQIRDCSEFRVFKFTQFGKVGLKKLGRIHPCAFVETCLQLAYMRKHGKPAPTYETATTRIFHKGRTETLRTCTPEAVEFCKAMINGGSNKKELFIKACQVYFEMMEECKQGKGCDRHLMGLSAIAAASGKEIPAIFNDSAYTKSGGGGNYILSTSFVGYSTAAGSTHPMRDDGYGAFFGINNDSISFVITALHAGLATSAQSFESYLTHSLVDCFNLFRNNSSQL